MIFTDKYCFNCNKKERFSLYMTLSKEPYNKYNLLECEKCKTVSAFHKDKNQPPIVTADYSEYNLSSFSPKEFMIRSNRISIAKRRVLNKLESMYTKEMSILDFGGGAGVFVKSCHNIGYKNVFLLEPSEALRNIAINQLGIPQNRVLKTLDNCPRKFDAITMFDVIEHLPIDQIREIISNLSFLMNESSSFIGTTPNISSINIALHGENDPVIAPPNHTIYFSKKSLNSFLSTLKFQKYKEFTIGLSHNSFFRLEKFRQSWVERPNLKQKPFAKIIRTAFKIMGYFLIPTSRGYHIFFWYKK